MHGTSRTPPVMASVMRKKHQRHLLTGMLVAIGVVVFAAWQTYPGRHLKKLRATYDHECGRNRKEISELFGDPHTIGEYGAWHYDWTLKRIKCSFRRGPHIRESNFDLRVEFESDGGVSRVSYGYDIPSQDDF